MNPSHTTATPIILDARDLMSKVIIDVKIIGCRQLAYRLWFGRRLIRLAGLAMNCDVSFREQE